MNNKTTDNNEMSLCKSWDSAAFAARLKEVIGEESVSGFAKKCCFAESMMRKYLLAASVPGADKLVSIARIGDVSLSWLAIGQGPRRDDVGLDHITPPQLAVVLEFERHAQRQLNSGTGTAIQSFVEEYNKGLLEIGQIGDIEQVSKDELVLWRDLAWERRVTKASIDEGLLRTSIEIADELMENTGKVIEPAKKAKLITAIYRLNATTEGGVERSMLVNLLKSLPQ